MPTARTDGVDLYYELRGRGPRLLFLNGSGGTIEASGMLLAPFEAAHVGPMDAQGVGEHFLAQSLGLPKASQVSTEPPLQVSLHGSNPWRLLLFDLHTEG